MKISPSHKLGANRNEVARKRRKCDSNFSQSRDIREDRSARQQKFVHQPQTTLTQSAQKSHQKDRHPQLLVSEHSSDAKRSVVLSLNQSRASKVTVAGTFNGWHPASTPLRPVAQDEWATDLFLEAGLYDTDSGLMGNGPTIQKRDVMCRTGMEKTIPFWW